MLSNIVMYEIDDKLSIKAKEQGVKYSRYADDITVSGKDIETVLEFEKFVRTIIRSTTSPKLTFNDEKRGLFTKGQCRMVTGLVLTPTHQISIGRERKRKISALLHRATLDQLDTEQKGVLKGLLGFCISTEVSFVERMRAKYGDGVVDSILKFHVPSRAEIIGPDLD
jgi:hypothetical protein